MGLAPLVKNKAYGTPKRDDKNAAKERRTPNERYPHGTIIGLCNRVLDFLLLVSRY